MSDSPVIDTVVFDVGNVLLRWDPRLLLRKLLPDEDAVAHFFAEVCPQSWNERHDAGLPWAEGVAEAVGRHPELADVIQAYRSRWLETLDGAIESSVTLLKALKAADVPVYAITNYSTEKWTESQPHFPFLESFDGAVVSAHEGVIKPDPRIYQILFDRYGVDPARAVFIDDSPRNIAASEALGMRAVLFTEGIDLPEALRAAGLRSW
ncbi:MAG: HAD family phosphatase [Rhodobacteraceae bacterium]|nr:HAD family phosphatase [Paracoccaceae bacterium]